MILCNFSNTSYHLDWYDGKWKGLQDFLKINGLDGIELLLHGNEVVEDIPKEIVKGLHLSYFPTWLEFYNGDDRYELDFPSEASLHQTFGGTDKYAIHNRFKRDFEIAKKLEAKYMVYHVGHVTTKDAFTFEFDYNNNDVLNKTVEIVNQTFTGSDDVMLLFENLWWPGLTLLNKEALDGFMSQIEYENKGVMLDLSHLLITNPKLKTLEDGVTYILETLENLGDSIHWIKGIHINSTLIYDYMKEDHTALYTAYLEASDYDKFDIIYKHISSLDAHIPFLDKGLNKIIEMVQPTYQMIEVVGRDKSIWEGYIKEQLRIMNDV